MPTDSVRPVSIKASELLDESDRSMQERQWDAAIERARAAGLEALETGDIRIAVKAGGYLERLQDPAFAARLRAAAGRIMTPSPLPEWDGASLKGRSLLIVQRIGHVGAVIRAARLIASAAQRADRCIVLAEPRLVPLFRRSFPGVDVRELGPDNREAYADADVVASYETLTQYLAPDDNARRSGFVPLRPDDTVRDDLQRRYRQDGKPLVGMCWYSTNERKDLPTLRDWAEFLTSLNACYVSLQYGHASSAVEELRALSAAPIIHDETVDSLADLDRFAAQIAALDAVVTISNTGAHLAGALGVPTYVVLDDKNHLIWPVQGRRIGWYPSVTLFRKEHREWKDVFAEARGDVERMIAARTGVC
jgi:hypothetical protein